VYSAAKYPGPERLQNYSPALTEVPAPLKAITRNEADFIQDKTVRTYEASLSLRGHPVTSIKKTKKKSPRISTPGEPTSPGNSWLGRSSKPAGPFPLMRMLL